mmetsp:Transcript_15994/g.39821  ORF Transcript_15994/g.39821 Transcript_15994/m.39821 type:complete len:392 (+) Transcript_15994:421-1596(+)
MWLRNRPPLCSNSRNHTVCRASSCCAPANTSGSNPSTSILSARTSRASTSSRRRMLIVPRDTYPLSVLSGSSGSLGPAQWMMPSPWLTASEYSLQCARSLPSAKGTSVARCASPCLLAHSEERMSSWLERMASNPTASNPRAAAYRKNTPTFAPTSTNRPGVCAEVGVAPGGSGVVIAQSSSPKISSSHTPSSISLEDTWSPSLYAYIEKSAGSPGTFSSVTSFALGRSRGCMCAQKSSCSKAASCRTDAGGMLTGAAFPVADPAALCTPSTSASQRRTVCTNATISRSRAMLPLDADAKPGMPRQLPWLASTAPHTISAATRVVRRANLLAELNLCRMLSFGAPCSLLPALLLMAITVSPTTSPADIDRRSIHVLHGWLPSPKVVCNSCR